MVHVGGGSTGATALYEAYRSYCRKMLNEDPMSQKKFGDAMGRKGFAKQHNRTGWHYLNMFLLDTSEEDEPRILPSFVEQQRLDEA
jgi:phage/plasmid-associated DNA primase